jgi:hypothetical protein
VLKLPRWVEIAGVLAIVVSPVEALFGKSNLPKMKKLDTTVSRGLETLVSLLRLWYVVDWSDPGSPAR